MLTTINHKSRRLSSHVCLFHFKSVSNVPSQCCKYSCIQLRSHAHYSLLSYIIPEHKDIQSNPMAISGDLHEYIQCCLSTKSNLHHSSLETRAMNQPWIRKEKMNKRKERKRWKWKDGKYKSYARGTGIQLSLLRHYPSPAMYCIQAHYLSYQTQLYHSCM